MKKYILPLIAAAGLAGADAHAELQAPKVAAVRVQNEEADPINRIDVFGKLPYSIDYFATAEEQGDKNFHKIRAQATPLVYGPVSAGTAVQYKEGTIFDDPVDAGLLLRIQGKPTEDSYAKLDVRYFPEEQALDWTALLVWKELFADAIGNYSTMTGTGFARVGIDYEVFDGVSVGGETKVVGDLTDTHEIYSGLRIKVQ